MSTWNPLVSVIIATRNESRNIERILTNLKAQTYSNIEVMVVDNGSSDNTRAMAAPLTRVYNLAEEISLEGVKNFRGAQVNFGAKLSQGEILFFPDADMTFDPELIAEAVTLLAEVEALYIPEIVMGHGFFGKIRNFERGFYNTTCIDAPRFVRREAYLRVGGFDERNIAFAPDDWDLTKQLKRSGVRFGITSHCKYHHEEWLDIRTYLSKKTAYLVTFDDYIAKWGMDDPDLRKQFGIWYRFVGVFVENGKWKRLLAAPHLALGMYALRFFIGFQFLLKKWRS